MNVASIDRVGVALLEVLDHFISGQARKVLRAQRLVVRNRISTNRQVPIFQVFCPRPTLEQVVAVQDVLQKGHELPQAGLCVDSQRRRRGPASLRPPHATYFSPAAPPAAPPAPASTHRRGVATWAARRAQEPPASIPVFESLRVARRALLLFRPKMVANCRARRTKVLALPVPVPLRAPQVGACQQRLPTAHAQAGTDGQRDARAHAHAHTRARTR